MSRNKDHTWRPCTYCSGASQKMLHSHYGGKLEEFCRPHCMSQYTVLYYGVRRRMHVVKWGVWYDDDDVLTGGSIFSSSFSSSCPAQMGRCDCCRKQGYMTEKLQCLGSVRSFCNLPCVLQYCFVHFERSQHSSSNGTATFHRHRRCRLRTGLNNMWQLQLPGSLFSMALDYTTCFKRIFSYFWSWSVCCTCQ